MSISKEIFGIERIEYKYDDDCLNKEIVGFNQCINLIDKYELNDMVLGDIISIALQDYEYINEDERSYTPKSRFILKAIIQNQSKIFVRKNEI